MKKMLIRRELRNLVKQGNHQAEIEDMLAMVIEVFREEFTEDTRFSQDAFLRECLENALERT